MHLKQSVVTSPLMSSMRISRSDQPIYPCKRLISIIAHIK